MASNVIPIFLDWQALGSGKCLWLELRSFACYATDFVIMSSDQCDQIWRNGELLWRKFTCLWQIFDSLFLTWQNGEPTLAYLLHCWTNFHCCKWPNIEK